MKKFTVIALAIVFASVSVFAGEDAHKDHKCGPEEMEKGCMICGLDADFKVTETKDGVVITITAKKDGADAKTIKENAKKWLAAKTAVTEDGMVTCPVMGTKMSKDKAYETTVYKGTTYYFCCKGCKGMFEKDPDKYIKK